MYIYKLYSSTSQNKIYLILIKTYSQNPTGIQVLLVNEKDKYFPKPEI